MNELLTALRSQVLDSRILTHKFRDLILDGSDCGRRALLSWASEDYWVSRQFPSILGALIAVTDDPDVRGILVENLWDEYGRGKPDRAHFNHYQRLMESVGGTASVEPCASVRAFVGEHYSLAERDPFSALAVFCYANEFLCQFEFDAISNSVDHYFPEAKTTYLRQIATVDARHTAELEGALELSLQLGEQVDPDGVKQDLARVLEIRAQFYDHIVEHALR